MSHSQPVYEGGPTPLEPLLDLRGTAGVLSVSVRTIYRLVEAGEL
jgi:hypothetical protein